MRIETSSIETGSSATISFGRNASACAKPTRCRWPPLSSCGNFVSIFPGGTSPTSSSTRSSSRRRPARSSSRRCKRMPRLIPCEIR